MRRSENSPKLHENPDLCALPFRGDAFRMIYGVQIASEIWVVHAFQKKSVRGVETPQREIGVVRQRLKRLKEALR